MFWELYQQSRINQATTTANRAASRAASQTQHALNTIQQLESKVDSLSLTCQALWELLRDRSKLTEEELMAKVNEIDLRDGSADGRMGSGGGACSNCGRILNQRHHRCMYCGAHKSKQHAFQS